jgi:hypothetical protein
MATKTNKGSGADDNAEAALTDEDYDSAYEDDLLELVERLARRRSRPPRRPVRPKADAEAEAEAESDGDGDGDGRSVPDVEAEPEAGGADTAGPEAAEGRASEPGTGGSPARRIRVLTILSVVLATALAAVSTFAFMQWREYGSGSSPQVVRQKVAERAGQIVGTLFTYDYHDAKGYLEKQAAVMTRAAAATVKPNWTTLTTLFETGKYVSTAQIDQVYVGDISGNKASVIVVVNNKLVTSRGIQNSAGATLQFSLAKENGVWLADAVPKLESTGVQTNTDLQGKPLQPAGPTPRDPHPESHPGQVGRRRNAGRAPGLPGGRAGARRAGMQRHRSSLAWS